MTEQEAKDFLKKYKVKKDVYEMNYERLLPYITLMKEKKFRYLKVRNGLYMDLNIDLLEEGEEVSVYAIAHNYIQEWDVMADPDMQIKVWWKSSQVEALTFQQDAVGLYQEVYPEPGKVCPRVKKELNSFLGKWLRNLKDQGFINALEAGSYSGKEDE